MMDFESDQSSCESDHKMKTIHLSCNQTSDTKTPSTQGSDSQTMATTTGVVIDSNEQTIGSIGMTRTSYRDLVKDKHKKDIYGCDVLGCRLPFKSFESLLRHRFSVHTKKESFDCEECPQVLTSLDEFKEHSLSAHDLPVLECQSCHFTTQYNFCLNRHKVRVHSFRQRFVCPIAGCDQQFYTEDDRRKHSVVHSKDRPFKCDVMGCDLCFTTEANLTTHKNRCHSVVEKQLIDCESDQSSCKSDHKMKTIHLSCNQTSDTKTPSTQGSDSQTMATTTAVVIDSNEQTIGSIGMTRTSYRDLVKDKNFKNLYRCDVLGCRRPFKSFESVLRHRLSFHTKKESFDCKECLQVLTSLDEFKAHSLSAHDMPVLECQSCPLTTQYKRCLYSHKLRAHSFRQQFFCPIPRCGQLFYTEDDRRNHLVVHSKDSPFMCDVMGCDLCFTTEANLTVHKNRCHSVVEIKQLIDCESDQSSCESDHKMKTIHLSCNQTSDTKTPSTKGSDSQTMATTTEVIIDSNEQTIGSTIGSNARDLVKDENSKNRYLCDVLRCRPYKSYEDFLNHRLLCHTKDESFDCKECPQELTSLDEFKAHSLSAHDLPVLECQSCYFTTQYPLRLYTHKSLIHKPPSLRCPIAGCDQQFYTEDDRRKHSVVHSKDRPFKCDVMGCALCFATESNLTVHKNRSHSVVEIQLNDLESDQSSCESDHKMKTRSHLTCNQTSDAKTPSTQGSNAQTIRTKAVVIDSNTKTIGSNSSTKKSHKNLVKTKKNKNKHRLKDTYVCQKCFRVFKDRNHLKTHALDAHNQTFFDCRLCDYMTTRRNTLKRHESRVHSPFECPVDGCDKRFFNEALRKQHLRVHSKDRPFFKCDAIGCDKSYKCKYYLMIHKKSCHPMAEKEVISVESSLTDHNVKTKPIHKRRKTDLKVKTTRKVWKHCCRWCGCSYRTDNREDFRQHTNFHINYRPFKCMESGCSHAFMSQLQLECHVRNGHKK